jgi:hypothetical protein
VSKFARLALFVSPSSLVCPHAPSAIDRLRGPPMIKCRSQWLIRVNLAINENVFSFTGYFRQTFLAKTLQLWQLRNLGRSKF